MRYMLLIHTDPAAWEAMGAAAHEKIMAEFGAVVGRMKAAGAYVTADRLRPVTTATTVRIRGGEALTTDGPFAETKEHFGGYFMIDVADLDEAIEWAAAIPSARYGSIEVRPVWE